MIFWIDAQLSPQIAAWLTSEFGLTAKSLNAVGLRDAKDRQIFLEARLREKIVIVTKDEDFSLLSTELGVPPQVVWIRCGNTSNRVLRQLLQSEMSKVVQLLQDGHALVEIRDAS